MVTDTLTVAEFAKAVGVSSRTVARWIDDKVIRATWSDEDQRERAIPLSEVQRLAERAAGADWDARTTEGAAQRLHEYALREYGEAFEGVLETARELIALAEKPAANRPARQAAALDAHFAAVEGLKRVAALGSAVVKLTGEAAQLRRNADSAIAGQVADLQLRHDNPEYNAARNRQAKELA
jgi:excisionase family DNA binding protein